MKKPRKPRHASPNSLWVALMGVRYLSADDQLKRAEAVALAVQDIKQGDAGKTQWSAVFDAVNMLEQFFKSPKIAKGTEGYIDEVQQVVVGIMDRQKQGKRALYAGEVEVLDDLSATWASVLSVVTHAEYFQAEEAVVRRVRQVLAGGDKSVRIVEAV
jgi:hypothetical protein